MLSHAKSLKRFLLAALACCVALLPGVASAQAPPSYPPDELDHLVSKIALYPDSLLAQVLAAATYPDEIQDAAKYADEHHYLTGDQLARAITEDHLTWDAPVQALIPFPSVLDMMASDMNWTSELGNAFLAQQQDVMDAVQRERKRARDYGYLRTNAQVNVGYADDYITIDPINPAFICVPVYDPGVVFFAPRPGFFVGGAIGWGYGISLGFAFRPWGWGDSRFYWRDHYAFVGGARWDRHWDNRREYVHPYSNFHRFDGARGDERHELIRRSDRERGAARVGHARVEEHRGGGHGRGH